MDEDPPSTSDRVPIALSAEEFACVLFNDETLDCWGPGAPDVSDDETLPGIDYEAGEAPQAVPDVKIQQVASGRAGVCAIDAARKLLCWT